MSESEGLERLIAAEQDERRRLALFLHDGPVQELSGIALMVDGALYSIANGRLDEAQKIIGSALERQRETIRQLRNLSFALEPVVLRDHGFSPALRELADQMMPTARTSTSSSTWRPRTRWARRRRWRSTRSSAS